MQDCYDPIMGLWIKLPKAIESILEHQIKDEMGQFDLSQPALKGWAVAENGDKVPFFCLQVLIADTKPFQLFGGHTEPAPAVLNTFKMNGEWKANLTKGVKASFKEDKRSAVLLSGVKDIMASGNVNGGNTPVLLGH